MIRVFIHPQQMCFAEVGQLQEQQIFCALSSSLDSNWSVAVTNLTTTPKIHATAYAFLRLPRRIIRRLVGATPEA